MAESCARIAVLANRGLIQVTGETAGDFLDNLITNDMGLLAEQPAIHAGLLTPQGKLLFEFFVVARPEGDGFLLETAREKCSDLVKRLTLYRLRAKVAIEDVSEAFVVAAAWGGPAAGVPAAVQFPDPRLEGLGQRLLIKREDAAALHAVGPDTGGDAYHRHRIGLGVPEADSDYQLGDTFPHEANFDRLGGVSFSKGCFVGQEVVARMQHKTVVRKRVVPVVGTGPLVAGADVQVGGAAIGRVGSVSDGTALALIRLDRAAEALEKGQPLTADGVGVQVGSEALSRYAGEVARAAAKP